MNDLSDLRRIEIRTVLRFHALTGTVNRRTDRECWGLAYKAEGSTEYVSKGKAVLSDPAHAVLLPKGADYEWKTVGGECLIVDFDAEWTGETPTSVLSFPINDATEFITLFTKLEQHWSYGTPLSRMKSTADFYSMLIALQEKSRAFDHTEEERRIAAGVDYLRKHYTDPGLTADDPAAVSGLSEVQFRRLFGKVYGCPPMTYVNRLRMRRAAELLGSDVSGVGEVARAVGYASIYHFSKMFKRCYGVAPSRFDGGTSVFYQPKNP